VASSKASGPSSFAEGAQSIVSAIAATMTTPDAGPHLAALEGMLKMSVGLIQKGNAAGAPPGASGPGGPPGAGPSGAPGGMPPGGGMNLAALGGGPPQGPSAGPSGGPSPSGASSDDIRRMVAAQAGTPS